MTAITCIYAWNMRVALSGCDDTVVTAVTRAHCLGVIDARDGRPARRRMARFAHVGAGDMANALAGCIDAVVTADAVASDASVVELGRCPRESVVTRAAILICHDVIQGFAA